MRHRGDYAATLGKWADAFGEAAITVRPFERDGARIDVVTDFLALLQLDSAALTGDPKRSRNPSPRIEVLHFLRAFNQLNLKIDQERYLFLTHAAQQGLYRSEDLSIPRKSARSCKTMRTSNRALAARFWHEATPLFPEVEDSPMPPVWALDDPAFSS